jgi:hypothetical protein
MAAALLRTVFPTNCEFGTHRGLWIDSQYAIVALEYRNDITLVPPFVAIETITTIGKGGQTYSVTGVPALQ